MRDELKKELSQHLQQEPEREGRALVEAGSSAPKRLQEGEARWQDVNQGGGCNCISCQDSFCCHGGEGPRRMYPQTLRYQGKCWYNPQTNQQVDSAKSPPGHSSQVSSCVTQRRQLSGAASLGSRVCAPLCDGAAVTGWVTLDTASEAHTLVCSFVYSFLK